jgi:hypothetical protein
MSLLSTLLLDESPLNSSTDTLQFSADGQIAVVTRSAIHIVVRYSHHRYLMAVNKFVVLSRRHQISMPKIVPSHLMETLLLALSFHGRRRPFITWESVESGQRIVTVSTPFIPGRKTPSHVCFKSGVLLA